MTDLREGCPWKCLATDPRCLCLYRPGTELRELREAHQLLGVYRAQRDRAEERVKQLKVENTQLREQLATELVYGPTSGSADPIRSEEQPMDLFSVVPIANPMDVRCSIVLRCARGWGQARWCGVTAMPCKISSISLQENQVEGTSVMLIVDFPDLETRNRFTRTSKVGEP